MLIEKSAFHITVIGECRKLADSRSRLSSVHRRKVAARKLPLLGHFSHPANFRSHVSSGPIVRRIWFDCLEAIRHFLLGRVRIVTAIPPRFESSRPIFLEIGFCTLSGHASPNAT